MSRGALVSAGTMLLAMLLAVAAPLGLGQPATTTAPAIAPPPKPISTFYREVWTTRQGLPHNQVNDMAQTPDGYL